MYIKLTCHRSFYILFNIRVNRLILYIACELMLKLDKQNSEHDDHLIVT